MSLITTKGAYGLMAVFEVSKGTSEHPVSINAISANIGVSRNYLEQILNALKKAGIISALKGMKGGYYLSKNLSEISFGEVLDTLENDFGFFAKDIEGEYKELFGTLDKELKKLFSKPLSEFNKNADKYLIKKLTIDSDHITLAPTLKADSYITSIPLTYTRPKLDATLDEKGENVESTISEIVGENKTLALNRTFNPSQLYTMCLPFDLSKEMITEIFGNETKVFLYDGYQDGELSFSTVKEGVLNAGMPFLMRSEYYVEQPTFAGVTVESTTAQTVGGGEWDLCGTFGSYELAADGTQLFLIADGTLAKPKADSRPMRGFRCYLQKHTGTVNGSAQLPSVTIDGETNAIKTAEYAAPTSATTAYSLSGMKLNAGCKTANGGIMIIDGKKFITTNR